MLTVVVTFLSIVVPQLTLERQRRHAEIFGLGPALSGPPPADPGSPSPADAQPLEGPGGPSAAAQPRWQEDGEAVPSGPSEAAGEDAAALAAERAAPKACPHCATPVATASGAAGARCCGARVRLWKEAFLAKAGGLLAREPGS